MELARVLLQMEISKSVGDDLNNHALEGVKLFQVFKWFTWKTAKDLFESMVDFDQVLLRLFKRKGELRRHKVARNVISEDYLCC